MSAIQQLIWYASALIGGIGLIAVLGVIIDRFFNRTPRRKDEYID